MNYNQWEVWKEAETKKWLEQYGKIPDDLKTETFKRAYWRAYSKCIDEKFETIN